MGPQHTQANRLSAQDWSTFWKNGTITTFEGRFTDNYSGEVKAFWETIFLPLSEGSNILDLATGNGALALLAAQLAEGRNIEIDAIDFAHIKPPIKGKWAKYSQKIRFHSEVCIENTGLAGQRFDCAVSQFGFEYADINLAVAEVNRLLKAEHSSFAAMLHHTDSVILTYARESIEQIQHCDDSDLLRIAQQLLANMHNAKQAGRSPQVDSQCEHFRQLFNRRAQRLLDEAQHFSDPAHINFFLQHVGALFKPQKTAEKNGDRPQQTIDLIARESDAFKARMNDLLSAASDERKIQQTVHNLQKYGFRVTRCEPISCDDQLFAWTLVARR